MVRIEFVAAVFDDLDQLDPPIAKAALEKCKLLQTNPHAGQPLHSPLTGFRKLVVGNRGWRVIYKISRDERTCTIWAIGPRSDEDVYKETVARLNSLGDHPEAQQLLGMMPEAPPVPPPSNIPHKPKRRKPKGPRRT